MTIFLKAAMSLTRRMSTPKKRKRTRNDIAMAYRIEALPRRIAKASFFLTLIDFLDGEIAALPEGWRVTWQWRNSRKSKLRSDSLENAVSKSRDSFITLMRRRLRRDLDNLRPTKRSPKRSRAKSKRRGKKKRTRNVSKVRKAKARRSKSRRVR